MLPRTGHYINLDRSQQRRSSIEGELRAAGILSSYRRFAAVDGSLLALVVGLTGAEFGCIRSHSEVILKLPSDSGFVHVLEDDAILARCFVAVLAHFIRAGTFDEYDLIFMDVFPWDPSALTPYADANALTEFAILAPEGLHVRLLTDASGCKPALRPTAESWRKRYGSKRPLKVVLSQPRALHDRLIQIDGTAVWDFGQSLRDFATRSPTSISRIAPDLAAEKIAAYAAIWAAGSPI